MSKMANLMKEKKTGEATFEFHGNLHIIIYLSRQMKI